MASQKELTYTFDITSTTTTNFDPVDFSGCKNISFRLELTTAATDAGDTLNTKVQCTWDKQTTWDDRARLPQYLGTATVSATAPETEELTVSRDAPLMGTEEVVEPSGSAGGTAASASTVRNGPFPPKQRNSTGLLANWRMVQTVVDAGSANAHFAGNLRVTYWSESN